MSNIWLNNYIEEISYHNDMFFQKDMERYLISLLNEQFSKEELDKYNKELEKEIEKNKAKAPYREFSDIKNSALRSFLKNEVVRLELELIEEYEGTIRKSRGYSKHKKIDQIVDDLYYINRSYKRLIYNNTKGIIRNISVYFPGNEKLVLSKIEPITREYEEKMDSHVDSLIRSVYELKKVREIAKERASRPFLVKVKDFLLQNKEYFVYGGIAAIISALIYLIYRKWFRLDCSKLSDIKRKDCEVKVINKALDRLRKEYSKCSKVDNKTICQQEIKALINKWENRKKAVLST